MIAACLHHLHVRLAQLSGGSIVRIPQEISRLSKNSAGLLGPGMIRMSHCVSPGVPGLIGFFHPLSLPHRLASAMTGLGVDLICGGADSSPKLHALACVFQALSDF